MHVIGLDYDDTFTTNPDAWYGAMMTLKRAGFRIVGATFRYPQEAIVDARFHRLCDTVVYCSRHSKMDVTKAAGELVDIWIDDMPQFIEPGLGRFSQAVQE